MKGKSIDWDTCVEIAGGKTEFAKEMLMMFLKELPEVQITVNDLFEKRDFTTLANQLHKLLGGCSYCGIPRLKELTSLFETAVKKNPTTAPLNALLTKFNQEVEAVLVAAKELEVLSF